MALPGPHRAARRWPQRMSIQAPLGSWAGPQGASLAGLGGSKVSEEYSRGIRPRDELCNVAAGPPPPRPFACKRAESHAGRHQALWPHVAALLGGREPHGSIQQGVAVG